MWPEAAALQAQVYEHLRQLQVLLSQRVHADAGWVLLKYVKNLNCFTSAVGLTSFMLCSGGVRMKVVSQTGWECVFVCVPKQLKIKRRVAPFRWLEFFYPGCQH